MNPTSNTRLRINLSTGQRYETDVPRAIAEEIRDDLLAGDPGILEGPDGESWINPAHVVSIGLRPTPTVQTAHVDTDAPQRVAGS
ncbi:hypothetical protein DT076_16690 [Desertihabitans brevis]|uniref:Uncharacterized protein n=1 Tax=Desertihabitans brevis TaxID=2268447 RepID=A0A367YR31_9ACTN|nr:hypothetical protein [Desertihabitans brevis]RCK68284.1 hypothetical protein DT076_16690 [Desertihabitans brevis]